MSELFKLSKLALAATINIALQPSGNWRPAVFWQQGSAIAPPQHWQVVDDMLKADRAFQLACAGTALIWTGDFQNARQLLQAMARRLDRPARLKQQKQAKSAQPSQLAKPISPQEQFHAYRLAQSQRARTLGKLFIPVEANFIIALRRAPNWQIACQQAYGNYDGDGDDNHYHKHNHNHNHNHHQINNNINNNINNSTPIQPLNPCLILISLRELLGIVGAAEWRRQGVLVPALTTTTQATPEHKIYPFYGVFAPIRQEYLTLLLQAKLPTNPLNPLNPNITKSAQPMLQAFDIGTGTGVLAILLAQKGVGRILATDTNPQAVACARHNVAQWGYAKTIDVLPLSLFPPLASYGKADLIVCNPPWLPARPNNALESAVYDPDSEMLRSFLKGLSQHLQPWGEGWLILSNLAEHLGLRSQATLLHWIEASGLRVLGIDSIPAKHPKNLKADDALFFARSQEITSLWRLGLMNTVIF